MKPKKLPNVSLENKKSLFLQIGFVIALAIVLVVFNWTTEEKEVVEIELTTTVGVEEELIPVTRRTQAAPLKPIKQSDAMDQLNIVSDDIQLEEELEISSTEIDEQTRISFVDYEIGEAREVEVEEEVIEEEIISFYLLEDKPEFPGGEMALLSYLATNTKYPLLAQETGISGRVYVSFIIDKKGNVTNVKLVRSVHEILDKEALRVVKTLPQWKPGKQRGVPVRVEYIIPITFVLG